MAAPQDALAEELRTLAADAGLDAIGFAAADPFLDTRHDLEDRKAQGLHGGMHFTYSDPVRSTDPSRTVPAARTLVVAARSYRRAAPVELAATAGRAPGRVARYSWRDEYAPLKRALAVLADHLRSRGHAAAVLVDDNALVDRAAAYRAGLGWWGKNANLLLPGQGSYFVLGSVVTDADLAVNPQPVPDGCGACTRCLPACPTGALIAPGVLDARRCLAWLLEAPGDFPVEFRVALGGRIYGCDDCQEACPPNRAVDRRDPPPPADADNAHDEASVDLVALLDLPDDQLLARFERWYVPRRQARYLRRNALVAIGNVGDPDDPDVRRVIQAARVSADPIVKTHADWAAARLAERQPESTPRPDAQPESTPRPHARPDAQPESTPQPHARPDAQPQPRPDARPDAQPRPDARPDARPEPQHAAP